MKARISWIKLPNKFSQGTIRFLVLALLLLSLLPVLSVPAVQAAPAAVGDVILIDFRESFPDPVGNWNTIALANQNSTVSGLIDSTGTATTVSYTGSGWNSGVSNTSAWDPGDKAWVQNVAADDGFSVFGGSATITLGGLAGSSYTVELVAASPVDDVASYTIGGNFADRTYDCTTGVNGDNFNAQTDGGTPGNWLIWDNVAPSGGNIVITIDASDATDWGDANALRLEEVNASTPVTMDVSKDPECTGGLTMADNSFLLDTGDQSDFFYSGAAGNVTTDLPVGVVQRWSRVWDCTVTDVGSNGGNVDITFDFVLAGMHAADPPAGTASNYKLLHRSGSSGEFSVIASGTAVDTGNWTVTFTGVDSTALGSQITLGTSDAASSPTAATLRSLAAGLPWSFGVAAFVGVGVLAGSVGLAVARRRRRSTM